MLLRIEVAREVESRDRERSRNQTLLGQNHHLFLITHLPVLAQYLNSCYLRFAAHPFVGTILCKLAFLTFRHQKSGLVTTAEPQEMTLDQYQAEQKRKAAERKEKQLKQQEQS